ncbi:hypothetical protein IWZ01DRAFT_179347 [Phyllosticta capitalensis]
MGTQPLAPLHQVAFSNSRHSVQALFTLLEWLLFVWCPYNHVNPSSWAIQATNDNNSNFLSTQPQTSLRNKCITGQLCTTVHVGPTQSGANSTLASTCPSCHDSLTTSEAKRKVPNPCWERVFFPFCVRLSQIFVVVLTCVDGRRWAAGSTKSSRKKDGPPTGSDLSQSAGLCGSKARCDTAATRLPKAEDILKVFAWTMEFWYDGYQQKPRVH